MGMIANYQQITEQELKEFARCAKSFEDVEDLQDDDDLDLCDLDKMWDALHFLLTGKSASAPIENDPISEAIVGQFLISDEDADEFISGIWSARVKEIAQALRDLDFETYLQKFDMDDFSKNEIYPDIWDYEEETEEIKEDLESCFEHLKAFYGRMAERNSAVLVSIY